MLHVLTGAKAALQVPCGCSFKEHALGAVEAARKWH
jgi:hypothetical protein